MRVIERVVVECDLTEDFIGSDDLDVSLDGRHIGSLKIKEGNILTGPVSKAIYPDDSWPVHAGSQLHVEEVDLIDTNDVILDHTFTAEEIESGFVNDSGKGSGVYRFQIVFGDQTEKTP
jgi:hypothetical protein